jgi:hypothetical protein
MFDSMQWKTRALALLAAGTMSLGTTAVMAQRHDREGGRDRDRDRGARVEVRSEGHERGRGRGRVMVAPPAVRVEVESRRPSAAHVWTPGYWTWGGTQYVWSGGRWLRPARANLVWRAPQWVQQDGGWIFVTGAWVQSPGVTVVVAPPPPPPPVVYVTPPRAVVHVEAPRPVLRVRIGL